MRGAVCQLPLHQDLEAMMRHYGYEPPWRERRGYGSWRRAGELFEGGWEWRWVAPLPETPFRRYHRLLEQMMFYGGRR